MVEILRPVTYTITSSTNKDTLISPFPICIPSFSFLISLAKTSGTILNIYGESGQTWLVPGFSGNAFEFPLFTLMLSVGLLCIV